MTAAYTWKCSKYFAHSIYQRLVRKHAGQRQVRWNEAPRDVQAGARPWRKNEHHWYWSCHVSAVKCSRYTGWEIRQCSVGETADLELHNKKFQWLPQEKGHFKQSDLCTKALR